MKDKTHLWTAIFVAVLVLFTVYVALDTFVITRVYAPVAEKTPADSAVIPEKDAPIQTTAADTASGEASETSQTAATSEADNDPQASESTDYSGVFSDTPQITDSSYTDENISITITEYREYDTTLYVADVYVSSPEYLKTALAGSAYGRNITEKTSEIAAECGAILAVNGDYYGAQSNGYVIRNGVLYRDSASRNQEDLVIWADGSFSIIEESEISAASLLADGAQQLLSFGPALITDGSIAITQDEEVGKAKASNPRTAIGIIETGHYLLVVADGRTDESEGLSLYQLAAFMQSMGADTAYNLDGGGSSTMVFNGVVINNPTTSGDKIKERSVSDIVYIG